MVFYTDSLATSPYFGSRSRVDFPEMLEPSVRQSVEDMLTDAQGQGIDLVLYESYRSQARHDLMRQENPSLSQSVGALAYGLAAEFAFGQGVNQQPTQDGDFTFLKALAESHGLMWAAEHGGAATGVTSVQDSDLPALEAGVWYPEPSAKAPEPGMPPRRSGEAPAAR